MTAQDSTTRRCETCQAPIIGSTGKWCNDDCRPQILCVICGEALVWANGKRPQAKTCSPKCAAELLGRAVHLRADTRCRHCATRISARFASSPLQRPSAAPPQNDDLLLLRAGI